MKLYDHQSESVAHLCKVLSGASAAVDASDTGTGKTINAVAVQQALGLSTVVVCPKPIRAGWREAALALNTELDIINYEKLRNGSTPFGAFGQKVGRSRKAFEWHRGVELVIFDEAHRCKNYKSLNAEMLRATRRQGIRTLTLSATLADTPLEMDALGYVLRLHDSNELPTLKNLSPVSFFKWAMRNGCKPGLFSPMEFVGTSEQKMERMAKLFKQIFPDKGVRVRIADLPWFPETSITTALIDLENPAKANRIYAEMKAEIAALWARDAEVKAAALKKAQEEYGFEGDELPEVALTTTLRQRQELELLKVPALVEMAEDMISAGMSVALFVNFSQTVEALCARLKTDCRIDGSQVGESGAIRREANRMDFQLGLDRAIVVQSDAGGVGLNLQDVDGRFPRGALIVPGFNAKLLRQIFGRVHRVNGRTKSIQKVIFAANTEEEENYRRLTGKLSCLDALQDGDLTPPSMKL